MPVFFNLVVDFVYSACHVSRPYMMGDVVSFWWIYRMEAFVEQFGYNYNLDVYIPHLLLFQ